MKMAACALPAAALLSVAGCGQGAMSARADEVACQRRIALVRPATPPPGSDVGAAFELLRAAYAAIPLQGCTEAQRRVAGSLAEDARRLADLGRRIGDVERAQRNMSGIAPDPDLLEFMSELERFDRRRRRLADELRAMEAAGK